MSWHYALAYGLIFLSGVTLGFIVALWWVER